MFVYNGTYYRQVFGTAMSSLVSAVVVNLVMEDVEHRTLASSLIQRYVDDAIPVVSVNKVECLLPHLNLVQRSIQFTFERENKRCLSLLDLNVRIKNGPPGKSRSKCSPLTHTYRQISHFRLERAAATRFCDVTVTGQWSSNQAIEFLSLFF